MKIVKIGKSKYITPKPPKGNYDSRQKYTRVTFEMSENELMGFTDFKVKSPLFDKDNFYWWCEWDELNDGDIKNFKQKFERNNLGKYKSIVLVRRERK